MIDHARRGESLAKSTRSFHLSTMKLIVAHLRAFQRTLQTIIFISFYSLGKVQTADKSLAEGLVWEKIDFQSLVLKLTNHGNDSEFVKLLKAEQFSLALSHLSPVIRLILQPLTGCSVQPLTKCSSWALSACICCERGLCTAAILQLERSQEGMLLALQSLPLGNQGTHVTTWWHPQMPHAALTITPYY